MLFIPKNKSSEIIFFIHIPKTAGATMRDIIEREFKRSSIYRVNGPKAEIDKFINFSIKKRNSFQIVRGHMEFGLHSYVSKPYKYVTILREPVARIISHYFYVKRTPSHYLHEKVVKHNMSLKEYALSDLSHELDNGQTRLIAGAEEIPVGECDLSTLNVAKTNLKKEFTVVGLTENFEETLMLFKQKLGWKNIFYYKKNVTQKTQKSSEYSIDLINAIKERNKYDLELYELAKEIFDNDISRYQGNISDDIRKFQNINKYLSMMLYYQNRSKKIIKNVLKMNIIT